jgi:lysophospholipase L1-like esterase
MAPTPVVTPTTEPAPNEARRTVVLVGDSTTYGTPEPRPGAPRIVQSPYNPAAALETLLAHLEPLPANGGTPWRGARVHNLGVGASTTALWLEDPPPFCHSAMDLFPVIKAACAKNVPWIAATRAAIGGARVDVVIVDLGLNDLLITQDPNETVERLVRIKKSLAPIPVIFFPPIAPPSGPRGDWPQRVRTAMVKRRLFDERQYPPYLPTFDGLHETDGGYAAKAALYIDALRKLP